MNALRIAHGLRWRRRGFDAELGKGMNLVQRAVPGGNRIAARGGGLRKSAAKQTRTQKGDVCHRLRP